MVDHSRTSSPVGHPHDRLPWRVVVPVKDAGHGKSRLMASLVGTAGRPDDTSRRVRLARAIAEDTLAAVAAAVGPGAVVLVTGDAGLAVSWRQAGAVVVDDPGLGLNAAVAAGLDRIGRGQPVAVLLGDLPAVTGPDLTAALDAAADHTQSYLPDAEGDGTVLRATNGTGGPLVPRFGPGSAARHAADGAVALALELPRLRRDVDDAESLAAARGLGLGPATAAALAALWLADRPHSEAAGSGWMGPMQATVFSFDASSRNGSVIDDEGVVVAFDSTAFDRSGLLHVRPGQRLTVELDGGSVVGLRLRGIGPAGTAEPVA